MTQSLSAADAGRTLALGVGERAVMRLPENMTTGYRWAARIGSPAVALVADATDYPDAAIGAGGEARFTLEARTPGSAEIEFRRWREWEGEGSIVERVTLVIEVTG